MRWSSFLAVCHASLVKMWLFSARPFAFLRTQTLAGHSSPNCCLLQLLPSSTAAPSRRSFIASRLTKSWFSGENSGSHAVPRRGVIPLPATDTLSVFAPRWIPQQKAEASVTVQRRTSDKQEAPPGRSVSACRRIPKNPNSVWHVRTQSLAAATLPALSSSIPFIGEGSTPMMPFPGFIYRRPTEALQWEHIVRIWSNPAVL